MFFFQIMTETLMIYILAAILPAIFLLRYIYQHDTIEKEPAGLLGSLILCGILAALCSGILEQIGTSILNRMISTANPYYVIFLAFLVVAAVEEGTKMFFITSRNLNE